MIIVMKPGAPMQECDKIKNGLINNGFQINEIVGVNMTILGVIGDTSTLDINLLRVNDWVEKVMRVQEPFKRANRMFHPEDSVVDVNGIKIGGKKIIVMAGPFQGDKEVLPNTAKRKANTAATKLDETANAKVTRIDSTTTGEALKRGGRKS